MIPIWVQRLPTIWVAFVSGLDPRMPPGAIVVSVIDAQTMVCTQRVSFDIAKAWAHGADVELPDDAPPAVRAVADRLRELLPDAARVHLPEIGSRFGVPCIAAAMAEHPTPPSIAELAGQVAEPHPDGVPRLSPEARLLRALTGL